MEPKPNYVLVGLFLTGFIAVTVFIILWIYGYRGKQEYVTYVILTEESVNGLREGSPVKYKGVDVGKVAKIEIDPKDPEILRIFIKIRKDVPIHADTVANVLPQGITGLAYISLSGGRKGKPYLVKLEGEVYPVIKLELSGIQKISRSLPEILSHVDELIGRMNRTFSDRNIGNVTKLLENLVVISGKFKSLEERTSDLVRKLAVLAEETKKTMDNLDSTVTGSKKLISEFEETVSVLKELSFQLKDFFVRNRSAYEYFSANTIYNLDILVRRLNRLVEKVDRMVEELEADPSLLIHGRSKLLAPGEKEE